MKIRCIKTAIEKPDKYISNSDMSDYLKVGALFWVYGLEFSRNTYYVYIFFDERHLIMVPLELFEIVDDTIPDLWKIRVEEYGGFIFTTLWPDLFYQENFWENFSEYEEKERQEFQKLRQLIEK